MKSFVKLAVLMSLATAVNAQAQGRHGAKVKPEVTQESVEEDQAVVDETPASAPSSPRKNLGIFSEGPMTSNGFTVSVIKSFMDFEVHTEFLGQKRSQKLDGDQNIGVAIGYDYVKLGNLGAKGALNFNKYDDDAESLRADANLTYGANEYFYLYGGLNLQKLMGDGSDPYETGFGVQAGLTGKITKNFGAGVAYVFTRHKIDTEEYGLGAVDAYIDISGVELNLNATF